MEVEEDHMRELRRLPETSRRHASQKVTLRSEYGEDTYPVESVLVFRCPGSETIATVKRTECGWRVTGKRRLRTWDELLRTVGHGYRPFELYG